MAMTSSRTANLTLPTDEQILVTREFAAPKHLVFKAYTTPELIKRTTITGTRDEVEARLEQIENSGADLVLYQAAGPDIPRRLTSFAQAAGRLSGLAYSVGA